MRSYGTMLSVRQTWWVQKLSFLRFRHQVKDLLAELGPTVISWQRWCGCISLSCLQWHRPSWLGRGQLWRVLLWWIWQWLILLSCLQWYRPSWLGRGRVWWDFLWWRQTPWLWEIWQWLIFFMTANGGDVAAFLANDQHSCIGLSHIC